jgi:hypothetical protein
MRRNHFGGQLSVKLNFLGAGGAGVVSTIAIDAALASWKMMWRRRRGGKAGRLVVGLSRDCESAERHVTRLASAPIWKFSSSSCCVS